MEATKTYPMTIPSLSSSHPSIPLHLVQTFRLDEEIHAGDPVRAIHAITAQGLASALESLQSQEPDITNELIESANTRAEVIRSTHTQLEDAQNNPGTTAILTLLNNMSTTLSSMDTRIKKIEIAVNSNGEMQMTKNPCAKYPTNSSRCTTATSDTTTSSTRDRQQSVHAPTSSRSSTRPPPPVFMIRDVVLGRLRGFPPWPGMIIDPTLAPPDVQRDRPSSKTNNFYCVQFFPAGDFSWLSPGDITKLEHYEAEDYLAKTRKKQGDLYEAYTVALDPETWGLEREREQERERERVRALFDEDEDDSRDSASRKRKRIMKRENDRVSETASSGSDEIPLASTVGLGEKKMKVVKRERVTKFKNWPKLQAKYEGRVEIEVESEDEDDEVNLEKARPAKFNSVSPSPLEKRTRQDHVDTEYRVGNESALNTDPTAIKLRDWRILLQKSFLSHKGSSISLKSTDMPAVDALFTAVERFNEMDIGYLVHSKIGKILRHISLLPVSKVPYDAEYKFRARARALVDKYVMILDHSTVPPFPVAKKVGEFQDRPKEVKSSENSDGTSGEKGSLHSQSDSLGGEPSNTALADKTNVAP